MAAVSGFDPAHPQVLCIGLPQDSVEQVARLLGSGVVVTEAHDAPAALDTLTLLARQGAAVPLAGSVNTALPTDIRLDHSGRRVLAGNRDLKLSVREFDLLTLLHGRPGYAWAYEELSERVWRQPYLGDPDTIATAIRRLRKRLGTTSSVCISAIRGYGYRLDRVK